MGRLLIIKLHTFFTMFRLFNRFRVFRRQAFLKFYSYNLDKTFVRFSRAPFSNCLARVEHISEVDVRVLGMVKSCTVLCLV